MDQVNVGKGIPLRVPAAPDDVDELVTSGPSVSFVLGADAKGNSKIFKVVKNLIGTAVVEAGDDAPLGLVPIKEQAWFSLPPIPEQIVHKLDTFFRAIDRRDGIESIVLLTFDPAALEGERPGEGWGVLVPEQENNAAHCRYEPTSVVDDKDDHVMIVGSVHSHPGMSAFASHTDHGDQADFDGLHITFGWSKNSAHTEYHGELQMSGTHFTLTPEQIFDVPAEPEEFPELETWMAKVTKKTWTPKAVGGTTVAGKGGNGYGSNGYGSYGYGYGGFDDPAAPDPKHLPAEVPNPNTHTVIAELKAGEKPTCPACNTWLGKDNIDRRRCDCMCFVLQPGETPQDLYLLRSTRKYPVGELDQETWWWKRTLAGEPVEILGKAPQSAEGRV